MKLKTLHDALDIFGKYAAPSTEFYTHRDLLIVEIAPRDVSGIDQTQLEKLGFTPSKADDTFHALLD